MRLVAGSTGVLVAVLLATTGCQGQGPALTRTDLVSDLAGRIDHAATLDYQAEYQVSGGSLVSVAQSGKAHSTAYRYPSGALIITPAGTTTCAGHPIACTTVTTTTGASHTADLIKHGLIETKVLSSLLTTAALDLATDYQQHESTIGGQPATCVEAHGLNSPISTDFEACVMSDGVIGSFTGDVDGTKIDFALTTYSTTLPDDAFAKP